MISLIANTGIQFFETEIDFNKETNFKLYFHEWFDTESNQLKLQLAHHFSEDDIWVKKKDLHNYGYLKDGKPNGDWETISAELTPLDSSLGSYFSKSIKNSHFDKFTDKWIPFPFFELNNQGKSIFGPTNWCRAKFESIIGEANKYKLILAFDTKSYYDEDDQHSSYLEYPIFDNAFNSVGKKFGLCKDEFLLIDFLSKGTNCEWVDKYILKLIHDTDSSNRLKSPKLDYLASFTTFLSYIHEIVNLPEITLHKDRNVEWGNVDIAIDIGNSRTSAVLLEEGDFTKVRMLELRDFSNPSMVHSDPFDMRLVFHEVEFGDFGLINSQQFIYPSMVRLGVEAQRLIYKAKNENIGKDQRTSFSSPKRYLWDDRVFDGEWEFIQERGGKRKAIWLDGISQQFNTDGSLNIKGTGGQSSSYSPKSLMTLAFIEILSQARLQINSYKYRNEIGNTSKPRKVNRIIVTCPTAMSGVEQKALRQAAQEASVILNRFYDKKFNEEISLKEVLNRVKVIPNPKSLSTNKNDENKDWIYDEASSVQFVYMFAEIGKRYQNNSKEFFDLYGKIRNQETKKSLVVGSLDIGAGTSDLMICKYSYDEQQKGLLTPDPIFWDSFYFAGDDLLKEFVKQFIIEGSENSIKTNLAKSSSNPEAKLAGFFGQDHASMTYEQRQIRRDFNMQISIPIALKLLDLVQKDKEDVCLTYHDIFKEQNTPTNSVLNGFKEHFGIEFKDLIWPFNKENANKLIAKTLGPFLQKIASLMYAYDCDFVLLSGRPTTLPEVEKLFRRFYPVSPNRLITMNNYRVGQWYPFQDGNGYFSNQKTLVGIGAIIAFIASELGSLSGFSLNLVLLKQKLQPTTEYFGEMNQQTLKVDEVIISPEINQTEILSSTLPIQLGTRQIDSSAYPSRTFYSLDIDKRALNQFFVNKGYSDLNEIKELVESEIIKIKRSKPLKFKIVRPDFIENKESLVLESVVNIENEELRLKNFRLQVQSIAEGENYWLDTGEFKLSVNTKN
jgi:hypothetical protein